LGFEFLRQLGQFARADLNLLALLADFAYCSVDIADIRAMVAACDRLALECPLQVNAGICGCFQQPETLSPPGDPSIGTPGKFHQPAISIWCFLGNRQ